MNNSKANEVKDYYAILNIAHNASTFQIEQAYEKLANQWLPEKHKNHPEQAQHKFDEINEAFQILYNRNSRAHYDQIIRKGYSYEDAESTFNNFFKNRDLISEEEKQFFNKHSPKTANTVKNYYEVLQLNNNAPMKDIEQSYRKLSVKYHPSSNPTQEAKRKFIEVNEAYGVLSNQKRRATHDNFFLREFDSMRTSQIFEQFFGRKALQFPKFSQEEFFQPVMRKRWSRMLDRLLDEDEIDYSNIMNGETVKQQVAYTNLQGNQTKKHVKTRSKVENGVVTTTTIEDYTYPNGQKQITKTCIKNGKSQKMTYHLKKGEQLPKELDN